MGRCKSVSKQGIRCASDDGHGGKHCALKASPIPGMLYFKHAPAKRKPRPRPTKRWTVNWRTQSEAVPMFDGNEIAVPVLVAVLNRAGIKLPGRAGR